jgi:hypothetical protein
LTVLAFSTRTFLLLPLPTNHRTAVKRTDLLHAYGQSAPYDATNDALKILVDADYPNPVIIIITDGMDNSSTTTQEQFQSIC